MELLLAPALGIVGTDLSPELEQGLPLRTAPAQLLRAADWAAKNGDAPAAEIFRRQAVANSEPGEERANARAELADLYRDQSTPEKVIEALVHQAEWAYLPARSFRYLEAAALETGNTTVFQWLATLPAANWKSGPAVLRDGVVKALKAKNGPLATQIGALFSIPQLHDELMMLEVGGRIWEARGERDQAISAYLRAANAGSKEPFVYRRVTMLLDKAKRRDEAAHWCREALRQKVLDDKATTEIAQRLARLTSTPEERKRGPYKTSPAAASSEG